MLRFLFNYWYILGTLNQHKFHCMSTAHTYDNKLFILSHHSGWRGLFCVRQKRSAACTRIQRCGPCQVYVRRVVNNHAVQTVVWSIVWSFRRLKKGKVSGDERPRLRALYRMPPTFFLFLTWAGLAARATYLSDKLDNWRQLFGLTIEIWCVSRPSCLQL